MSGPGGGGALSAADLAVLAGCALLLGLLARARRRERSRDYLLAGRTLTLPAFVATLVSTWYGGVLGVGEYSYLHGLSNWVALGGPYYVAGLLFAFLLARRAREANLVTVPERLLRDHGPAVAVAGSILVLVNMLPGAYILMLGVLAARALGVPLPAGILLAAVVSFAVVSGGGFASVVRTNAFQFVLMYGGFAVVLPFAWRAAGGLAGLRGLPPAMLAWDGGLGIQAVLVWYVIALQTLVEPTFYQRCFAARDPRTARRGILWAVAFWVLFDGMTTLAGMLARVVLPSLPRPVDAYPALAEAVLPPVLLGVFYAGMLATVMSTVESYLFVAATTLGYDLPRVWRAFTGSPVPPPDDRLDRPATRRGLLAVTLLATGLAFSTESVVTLWKTVGSVITPALLLPLVGGFHPRWRAGRRATLLSIAGSALVALAWAGAGIGRGGGPFLGIEPIFPALGFSVACHLPAWARGQRSRAQATAPASRTR